ncbi:hypothetical protein E4U55_000902 [Claviceps digitariae]|nr:hypothetical protein E4U55_000902 [Claviceps digitariae]
MHVSSRELFFTYANVVPKLHTCGPSNYQEMRTKSQDENGRSMNSRGHVGAITVAGMLPPPGFE